MPRLITLKRDEPAMMLQAMTALTRPSSIGDDTSSVNPDYMRYPLHYHPAQTPHDGTPAGMELGGAFPSRWGATKNRSKRAVQNITLIQPKITPRLSNVRPDSR